MNNIAVDILPVALLITFIWGMHPVKPISSINKDYLSIDTGMYFRGLLAVAIVFAHLAHPPETGLIFQHFSKVGFLAVSVFFFYSGYGLLKSYIAKQEKYRKSFLFRRILPLLFLYAFVTMLYWMINIVNGNYYSVKDIIMKTVYGSPIVSFSWYIVCILFFYVVFWILMIACQQHYFIMICGGCLWYILYIAFCKKMDYGYYWYYSCHLLFVGMFWAVYEEKIIKIIVKFYSIFVSMIWSSFIILYCFCEELSSLIPIAHSLILLKMFISILFVISILLFSLKFQVGNKVLRFLGNISLEIYLSQGLFIAIFRGKIIYVQNETLWCVLVLAGTIIFAYILHSFYTAVIRKYQLLLNKMNI